MKKIISLLMILVLIIAASSISFTSYNFERVMDKKVDETSAPTLYINDVEKEKEEIEAKKEEEKKAAAEKKEEYKKTVEEKKEDAKKAIEEKKAAEEERKEALDDVDEDKYDDDDKDENSDEDDDDDDEITEDERKAKFKDEYKKTKFRKNLEEQLESLDDDDDENDSEEIADLKKRVHEIKLESVKLRNEIRKAIRKNYTEEELAELEALKAELMDEYDDIKVLGIDSVLSNAAVFKFDTPPVIKAGRTLLPVSAITKGIGADIEWIADEQKIIIKKGEDVIELWIDKKTALVNGEEVELDASPELMNSRTIVPLRFIVETFNFKVEWNEEDETIEIIDEEELEEEEAETVSGS